MSAIGSCEVLKRARFAECLALARNVHSETTGKWIFKQTRVVGVPDFHEAWNASVLHRDDFGYSGYVLGNYLDAQLAVNNSHPIDEQSEPAKVLSEVFTAAFVFEAPLALPDMAPEKLKAFCLDEYGADGDEAVDAIRVAHEFYTRGLAEIMPETLVAFVIR